MSVMTPREIVAELDQHIIGQSAAKRAVAIALRNRWRRMQVDESLRVEITPKNILMIGPTGVGKTEISRRLAHLAQAPFIKVEATKFTEVGYVGKDVDSIIRDLMDAALKIVREKALAGVRAPAREAAEERVLDALLPGRDVGFANEPNAQPDDSTRNTLRKRLRDGELDEREIDVELSAQVGVEIMAPPGMEEMTSQLQGMFQNLAGSRKHRQRMKVAKALAKLEDDEAGKLLNDEEIKNQAVELAEQHGIVFIDELDKVCKRANLGGGGEVSREGVQRDLLPLVEGCTVNTKYGMVKTDHVLFIASGAFHFTKPSDLIPELQGRLPIRVELRALTADDFVRILTEPNASLTEQYQALMATEGVQLHFKKDGVKRLAQLAWQVNERTENIGARRLHTLLERLLDTVSFEAPDRRGDEVVVDQKYVDEHLDKLAGDEDLSRYIL